MSQGSEARSVRVARIGDVIELSENLTGKAAFAAGQVATIESTFEMGGITTYRCRIADGRTVIVRGYHLHRIEDRPVLAPGVAIAGPDDEPRMYGDGGDEFSMAHELQDLRRRQAQRREETRMAEVRISHTDGTPATVIQTSDPDAIREFEELAFTDDSVSVVEVREGEGA